MNRKIRTVLFLLILVVLMLFWYENRFWMSHRAFLASPPTVLPKVSAYTLKANRFINKALRYNRDKNLRISLDQISNSLENLALIEVKDMEEKDLSLGNVDSILSSTTLLLNGVNELSTAQIQRQIMELTKSAYKNILVIIAVPGKKTTNYNLPNVKTLILGGDQRGVLRKMLANVNTKYVIIARDTVIINLETSIPGLLLPLLRNQADIVGSTYLNEQKEWLLGCSLTRTLWSQFRTFDGVEAQNLELIVCDSLMGPFVAQKDELLSILSLDTILLGGSMFYVDLFYHISEMNSDKVVKLCLQCSSEIETKRKTAHESEILQFLKGNQLSTMILSDGSRLEHECDKIALKCSVHSGNGKKNGMLRPRCCIMELHYLLVRTSEVLNKHKFPYELDGGTVLGAVKLSDTLPWDLDHDYEYRLSSKSHLLSLRGEIEKLGYQTEARENYVGFMTKNWRLEANGVGAMMRDFISLKNNSKISYRGHHLPRSRIFANATLVQIGSSWIPNNSNPGQFARQRYGLNSLKHAWHWAELGRSTSHTTYEPGEWGPCVAPGHHSCANNYLGDGSLQFRDVW